MVQEPFCAIVPAVKLAEDEPAVAVAAPPQVFVSRFGVATTKPAGRGSVNATPVRPAGFAAGFVIVNVNEVVPFSGIVEAPNAMLIVGAAAALRFAVAVVPVPPFVELTGPVVLMKFPAAVAVTFTTTVQLAPTAAVAPLSETLPEPAAAVAVPPQLFTNAFGVATTVPVGSESVKATPLSATVLAEGLLIVKVSEVVPFTPTPVAPNALLIEGGATTLRVAVLLTAPVPLSVEEIAPVVLGLLPAVVPVTFTLSVQ